MPDSIEDVQGISEPLVSACLIVRNEAENLPRCVVSLRSLVDEVIVVDTGSVDDTIAIARDLGAKVFEETWQDDFSLHRNQAIERANGKWILIIDADEELHDTNTEDTRERLESDGLPDILLATLELRYPDDRTVSLLAPRLLRRSAGIRYVYPVHEQLDVVDASGLLSNVKLLHHGYDNFERLREKEMRNLRLAEASEDSSPHLLHCIVRSAFSLKDWRKAADTALRFLLGDMPPLLAEEVCALGAAASFKLGDAESIEKLVATGTSVTPESPDVHLMAALAAVGRYLDTLRDGDSTSGNIYLRPPVFRHDASVARRAFEFLLGVANEDRSGDKMNETGGYREL